MKIWSKLTGNKNFQSTFVYTLTSFINQFGNILVLPIVWKGLTIEDFAVIGLVEAAAPFLACIISLSSEQYVTRYYFTWQDHERSSNISKNLTLNFLAVFLLGIFSLMVLFGLGSAAPSTDWDFYGLGLAHIIFFSSFAFPNALFRISNDIRGYVAFTLSLFFVRLLLSYIFTIGLNMGLYGYLVAQALTSLLFAVILYIYLFARYSAKVDLPFFRQALAFSLPFIPSNLMTNISTLADRLVVSSFGGKFETGLLTLGQKIASIPGSLSQAIKLGYVPYITEFVSRPEYSVRELNRSRMVFVTPVSVLSFFLMLFGVELLQLIDIDIQGLEEYLYLLLFIVYLNANNLFFSPGLYLAKRSEKMWLPNFIQLVLRLGLYALLVPVYVLKGVVLASLFASLASFLYNYFLSEKYFRLRLSLISIALQFLPFIITLTLTLVGIELLALAIFPKMLIMGAYLGVLTFFLTRNHEETAA